MRRAPGQGDPSPEDLEELRRFQQFLRDLKAIRDSKKAGLPCPLSPERMVEFRKYAEGED